MHEALRSMKMSNLKLKWEKVVALKLRMRLKWKRTLMEMKDLLDDFELVELGMDIELYPKFGSRRELDDSFEREREKRG